MPLTRMARSGQNIPTFLRSTSMISLSFCILFINSEFNPFFQCFPFRSIPQFRIFHPIRTAFFFEKERLKRSGCLTKRCISFCFGSLTPLFFWEHFLRIAPPVHSLSSFRIASQWRKQPIQRPYTDRSAITDHQYKIVYIKETGSDSSLYDDWQTILVFRIRRARRIRFSFPCFGFACLYACVLLYMGKPFRGSARQEVASSLFFFRCRAFESAGQFSVSPGHDPVCDLTLIREFRSSPLIREFRSSRSL